MHEFCSVIHPQVDTFESIRQNSSFLFHTIIYLGARALPAAQGDMLQVATEEARCSWKKALIDETPTLQTVQALTINACWHDNAYITSGIAMRMALHMRWHLLTHRYDRDAWSSNNENMRPRICQVSTLLLQICKEEKKLICRSSSSEPGLLCNFWISSRTVSLVSN